MEEDLGKNCNCEGDCCPPKKKNPYSKFIFGIVILAAVVILAIRLAGNRNEPGPPEKARIQAGAGCDTSKNMSCDTTKGASCCPKN